MKSIISDMKLDIRKNILQPNIWGSYRTEFKGCELEKVQEKASFVSNSVTSDLDSNSLKDIILLFM